MAMDTRQKRMSAMNLAQPWRGPLVDATESGFTQGNRQAGAFQYSGILAAAAGGSSLLVMDRATFRRMLPGLFRRVG